MKQEQAKDEMLDPSNALFKLMQRALEVPIPAIVLQALYVYFWSKISGPQSIVLVLLTDNTSVLSA